MLFQRHELKITAFHVIMMVIQHIYKVIIIENWSECLVFLLL